MNHSLTLGHLVFGVRKPARWHAFCSGMLGLPDPVANADGSLGWRVDGAAQRLLVVPDRADDLLAIGLDCGDAAGLDARVRRLRDAGHTVERAPAALAAARRVEQAWLARDPAGNAVELVHGAQQAATPFTSSAFAAGFRTGDAGLGHAVLVHRDLGAMEEFYTQGLGFGVTERLATQVGPVKVRGIFLHCNRRHHTLALFDLPARKRPHHFMLQANDVMDVGRAFERTRQHKVPLSLDIGQHPGPDGTFSFYGQTPSGFDFEIGAGSGEIDPAGWDAMQTDVTSTWGHKPQLGLKLRMASALVANGLGFHPTA